MLAYRLINQTSMFYLRSFCTHCHKNIAFYDLIPVLSWFILSGKCRYCKKKISVLYPIIELFTLIVLTLLFAIVPEEYILSYFLFFSALIITTRSDLEYFLISRYATLYLIPVAFILSYFNFLPVNLVESIAGAIFGYSVLWTIATIFSKYTGKNGVGQGDLELLAMIGSFVGILGVWISLCIGSIIGSLIGITILLFRPNKNQLILPFGPFLSLGAIIYVLFGDNLLKLIYKL